MSSPQAKLLHSEPGMQLFVLSSGELDKKYGLKTKDFYVNKLFATLDASSLSLKLDNFSFSRS